MKRLLAYTSILICFTAFTCVDEPLDDGLSSTNNSIDCTTSAQNVSDAITAFIAATDDTYSDLCNNYKTALQQMITSCGDDDGSLQAILDSLGDCSTGSSSDCASVQAATQQAETNYNSASNSDYTTLCNAYIDALNDEITACGDDDGSLQDTIDSLGDCTQQASGVLEVTTGTLPINFIDRSATLNGTLIQVNGSNTDNGANYHITFEVLENDTGIDTMQNFILTLNGSDYVPNTDGFDDFTSTITTASGGIIQGEFSGIVSRVSDGADLSLSSGVVDMTY